MFRRLSSQVTRAWRTPKLRRSVFVGLLALITFFCAVVLAAWTGACAGNTCPSIEGLDRYDPNQASKVYAADGRLITDLGLERRTVVPLPQMSPYVKAAFIATEDKRFYEHQGIDWVRVVGAIRANVFKLRFAEGFSTITMQLARNLWPEDISGRDKSLRRKLREIKVAMEIEKKYPKDKILELYLNQIDLGNRAYGVEAASQRYFGKSVRDVNLAEAATLAAIPKAPSRYNPRRNPNLNIQRRNTVINLLRDDGELSERDAERWKAYPLLLSSRSDFSGVAEYFVEYVRQQLDARFGPDLYREGLRIYTTLDLDVQQAAERALEARLQAIEAGADGKFPHQTYQQYLEGRGDNTDDNANIADALSPGPGRDARGQDRLDPRDGRRPGLRGQQVQPGHPVAAATRLHLQADRLLGRGRSGLPALLRGDRRAAHGRAAAAPGHLDAAELRPRVRGADDAAARASCCRATSSP